MNLPEYPFHEIAELFPLMKGEEFEELKRDIHENGQREPIWLHHGHIIDGRNRYRACRDLGRPVLTQEWDGNGSLVAFVQSLNLRRRHLDESQRAIVAAKIKRRFEEEASQRKSELLNQNRRENGVFGAKKPIVANLPPTAHERSRDRAAKEMNVSPRTVDTAGKILDKGIPELITSVEQGEVSVSAAGTIADLPKPQQEAIVAEGPTSIIKHSSRIRGERVNAKRSRHAEEEAKDEPEKKADGLEKTWLVVNHDLQKIVNSLKPADVTAIGEAMEKKDRSHAIDELKRYRDHLTSWIKLLEKTHASKIRTLN